MTVDDRRIEFGEQLRQLREAAGLTGRELAERAGWQQSKVSRIERAQQSVTDGDVRTWCRLTGATEHESELLAELRSIRLDAARWKARLRRGHQHVQESFAAVEHEATTIRVFETAIVPGLLQTPDYARAVFTQLAQMRDTPRDADDAVHARMQRQSVLYDSTKRIEILIAEQALHNRIAPADVMAGQLDRLLAVPGLRTVRFGILPADAALDLVPLHAFWILDDLVNVELLHSEVTSRDPDDVAFYSGYLDRLWATAAESDEARAILSRAAQQMAGA